MAVNTKHFLSIEKRDLTNAVILTTPTRTPFATLLMSKGIAKAEDTIVNWRERDLSGVRGVPLKEGAEAPAANLGTRRSYSNYTQIFARTAAITSSAANITVLGFDNTLKQIEIDKMIEAKLDLNHYAINGVKADEDATNGRQMGGLLNLITQKQAAVGALSYDVLKTAMQTLYKAGTDGDKFALMNSDTAMWIDKLPELKAETYAMSVSAGANDVEIFVTRIHTRFGIINVLVDEDTPDGTIAIFDLENVELAELQPFTVEPLAKTGVSERSLISGELTFKLLNSKSAIVLEGVTAPVVTPEAPAAFAASIAEALATAIPAAAEPAAEPAVEAKKK